MSKKEIEDAIKKNTKDRKDQKEKTDKKDEQIAELTDDLKRLQAEFENFKKRTERENASFKEYAEAETIKQLLPILDNFELALKNTDCKDEFVKGMELIYSQMFQLLEDKGVKRIDCVGKHFDPHLHEALLSEKSEKEEGTVLEELQRGYMIKGRVLRHAKVKVAKK